MSVVRSFADKYSFWVKCVGIIWCVLAVTFLFYTATYFLGNHDFRFVRYGMPLLSSVFEGRFSQFLPPYLLTMGQILPLFNVWLGFMFLSASVVLLAKWYEFEEKGYGVVGFGLLIVLNPYFLTQFYYLHLVLSFCFWHFLSIVGVLLVYEGAKGRIGQSLAGVLCLVLSFGGYASSLELVAVILLGKMWLDILSGKKFDSAFLIFYLKIGFSCLIALLIYMAVIWQLKMHHILDAGMYNVQVLSGVEILRKFLYNWKVPFGVLASSLPVCGREIVWSCGALCALALLTGKRCNKLVMSIVWMFALVHVAFLLAFASAHDFFYVYRVHCYSVPYLWGVLFTVICRYGTNGLRNAAWGLVVLILVGFVRADFEVQKIWHLGNSQDERLVERVRQEILPLLKKGKHYRLATIGDISGQIKFSSVKDKLLPAELRERYREFYSVEYYLPIYFSNGLFLYETENPIWADALRIGSFFYYSLSNERVEARDKIAAHIFAQSFGDDKENMLSALSKMRPYPHPNYYFIGQKDIFLMFGEEGNDREILYHKIMNGDRL